MNKSRLLSITIEDKKYTVAFPNVEQLLRIQALKQLYSNNLYGKYVASATVSDRWVLDAVDTISTFQVLIPTLESEINGKDFMQMDPIKLNSLIRAYKFQFSEWYESWLRELYTIIDEKQVKHESNSESIESQTTDEPY